MEQSIKLKKIFLKDYKPPVYSIDQVNLDFNLDEHRTFVRSTVSYSSKSLDERTLFLDGENIKLLTISMNGKELSGDDYMICETGLQIHQTPNEFTLVIENEISPSLNTSLEGLYISNGILCTQCEAQGFRKITYFMDRPDVMSKYQVSIEADKTKYPILLSNGNLVSVKDIDGSRHRVEWSDPFKKPSYLFALVAGNLGFIKKIFTTRSGKKVDLMIYAQQGKQHLCHHAMNSLEKAMVWDEEKFGLEYDLNFYGIVAIDDFNAGAMENKGLNIFNSKLIMASEKSATDEDYLMIESVVAHEYFHNWTGNRVTLRDWFQLSLKEGLTVFRDQEFSADMTHPAVQRIFDVLRLQSTQFPEDSGPNAHPVRPESCLSVDNFFTPTIYEKGAELIRMMRNFVGDIGFRRGMETYFSRHDGEAVTIEDFVAAIADANKMDLTQFKKWYEESGTPTVSVIEKYDDLINEYSIHLNQNYKFHIPLFFSLIDSSGKKLEFDHPKIKKNLDGQYLIELKDENEKIVFKNLPEKPILSILQNFSAPVYLKHDQKIEDTYYLAKYDTDGYSQWQKTQKVALQVFKSIYGSLLEEDQLYSKLEIQGRSLGFSPNGLDEYLDLLKHHLVDKTLDPYFKSFLISRPQIEILIQDIELINPKALLRARLEWSKLIATHLKSEISALFEECRNDQTFKYLKNPMGRRRLKNVLLEYISFFESSSKIFDIYKNALNMTDKWAALNILCADESLERKRALTDFYEEWKDDSLVLNKWFSVQVNGIYNQTFKVVKELRAHPKFNINNPNHIYSLLRTFGKNIEMFNSGQLEIYAFYIDQIIEIDSKNPQVAARLCDAFVYRSKLPLNLKKGIEKEISRALEMSGLSKNTRELLEGHLKNP